MKKSILFIAAIFAAISLHAQQRFTIKGELPDSLDGAVIQLTDYEGNRVCEKTFLKNGRFEFKGEIERDSIRRIDIFHNERPVNYANFIVEAGEIMVDFQKHLAKGTPLNDAMASLDFEGRAEELHGRWNAFRDDPSHSPEEIERMDSVFYTEASPYVRNFGPVRSLKQTIENSLAVSVGSQFKDLDFPKGNPDGTPAKLSDYVGRGRYILVDFWASWCGPCRGETPNLKAVYDRFHGEKFDILSVAVHDHRENSLQYIADERIPWPQILEADFPALTAYGTDGIPLLILFSPDGRILALNLRGADIMKAVEKALTE